MQVEDSKEGALEHQDGILEIEEELSAGEINESSAGKNGGKGAKSNLISLLEFFEEILQIFESKPL